MDNNAIEPALRNILEEVDRELSDYFVAFARLLKKASPEDAELAGSGTFVEFAGLHAILTADHVIENLPSSGKLGLILPTRFEPQLHKPIIDLEYIEKVTVAKGPNIKEGPDIGLLVLPPMLIGTIKARKSFYNLGKRRDQILSNPPTILAGIWILSGAAEEWTKDTVPEGGFDRVKVFRGMSGAGLVNQEYTSKGYDFIDFETKYNQNYQGPRDYGGVSGGGLWQIMVERSKNSDFKIKERILSGVAFYQTTVENNIRIIKCNGRRTIYQTVIDAMRARA